MVGVGELSCVGVDEGCCSMDGGVVGRMLVIEEFGRLVGVEWGVVVFVVFMVM